jgi:hypothetical protein
MEPHIEQLEGKTVSRVEVPAQDLDRIRITFTDGTILEVKPDDDTLTARMCTPVWTDI